MEMANQYGINLAAIDQAVSAKKTAEQNILANKQNYDYNNMKINALATEEKNNAEDRAKKLDLETQAKNAENLAKHAIFISKLPDHDKVSATKQLISQLPQEAQAKIFQEYNINPNDDNSILQALPHMTMATLKSADILKQQWEASNEEQKQNNVLAEEGFKHANKLDEINALYGNKKEIAAEKNKSYEKVASMRASTQKQLAEYKAKHGGTTGKPTVFDKKVAALVRSGKAKTEDEATLMIMNDDKTTNVNDPVMGNKVITSHKNYGNGIGGNKKPLDINKYIK